MMFRFWVWIVVTVADTIGGRPPWLTAPRTPATTSWTIPPVAAWVGSVTTVTLAGAVGVAPAAVAAATAAP